MELWDGYRADGSLAGQDLYRGKAIPEGLFHAVSEILVRHRDGEYLVTQRDPGKATHPGLWEASAGGSVLKGETPAQGAARELWEETGVRGELSLVYAQSDLEHTLFWGYLCVTDQPKDAVVLQAGETVAYRWVGRRELMELVKGPMFIPSHWKRWQPFLKRL